MSDAQVRTPTAGARGASASRFLRAAALEVARPSAAVIMALLIGAVIIRIMGEDPVLAYRTLISGAFNGTANLVATLQNTTPLLFTGLAVGFAFRSNVANIGVEGQMLFGALAAGIVGYYVRGLPHLIHLPLAILAAMAAGAAWAYIPAFLKSALRINELVVCLMLNPMALLLTGYISSYPLKAPGPTNKTYDILPTAHLHQFSDMAQLNTGFIIAVVLLVIFWFIENRTKKGYEWKLIGQNPVFSRYGGIDVQASIVQVFLVSGMIAGLAGAEQALGVYRAFYNGFSPGYGFDGIAVAMLAKFNPLATAYSALLLGALNSGGIVMQMMTSVTRDLIKVLEAIIILLLAADFALGQRRRKRRDQRLPPAEAPAGRARQ
ncbi:MAG TPA: ABC transporter permease [Spirochaetia bacterium]|nr:ABC transporter permease [Spirochaetia bacterium]